MNKFLVYIVVGFILITLADLGMKTIHNTKSAVEANPINAEGQIKDGYSVDFETEKKLSDESIKLADKQMEDDIHHQFIYTFNFCFSSAKEIDSYECIGNLMQPSAYSHITTSTSNAEVGKEIYEYMTKGKSLVGLNATNETMENENFTYVLEVQILEKRYPFKFKLTLKENKITSIVEISESEEE